MENQEIQESGGSRENSLGNLFKQFDIVTDFSDHHYAKLNQSSKNGDGFQASKVAKRIMQEWKSLEKDLPESIYVRVYEERIDLLRAVIIGAEGTPYHDGLFFFDLRFPGDYPLHPPEVYYHSYGLRINPNLYANGRVCLSLLNTWTGRKNEKWNANESTVLQVLVSIQALVLNEKPYYNEPGVKPGWQHWEKKALHYNEDVFVLNCKTMLFTMSRPPMHFKEFVASHFRDRALAIVMACRGYMYGHLKVCGVVENGSGNVVVVSKKFKAAMEVLYPRLLKVFEKNGSSVGNFVEQFEVEKGKGLGKAQVVKTKDGFARRVVSKVKRMLGFKKVVKKSTNRLYG